jgi:quercetin dioxygenase-like cupin family protein
MKNEIIRLGRISIRFLFEPADTNGSLAMFEFTVPAGAKVPIPHYHKEYDETAYGLEGEMTFTVDGKIVKIGPGDSVFIPRGVPHGFNNLTQTDAKALAVITPGLLTSEFFKEIAAMVTDGKPPDVAAMKAIMLKHGLVPVIG